MAGDEGSDLSQYSGVDNARRIDFLVKLPPQSSASALAAQISIT